MSNNQILIDNFEKEPSFDDSTESGEELNSSEIQDKIIAYFELGKTDLGSESAPRIDEATRDNFLKDVASGDIDDQHFQNLIKDVLMCDKSENKDLVSQYEEQIENLKQEAEQKHSEFKIQKALKETQAVVSTIRDDSDRYMIPEQNYGWDNASMRIAENTSKTYEGIDKVEMIYPARGRQIIDQVTEDKEAGFNQDKKKLMQAGLLPKYRLQVGPRIVNFSLGVELGNGYTAVIGYVETDGAVSAETFYRDDEMGRWRYANEEVHSPDGRGLFVPEEIQNFLSEITASGQPKIDVKNAREIFPEVIVKNVP